MEFGAIIVILTIAIMIFFSFNMISVYNRIIMLQSSLIKKFEPIDLSIKKYIDILNELIKIVSDEKDSEELLILAKKLSRVSDNEKKLLDWIVKEPKSDSELRIVQRGIETILGHQFFVIALLHDIAIFHDKNQICISDGR